MKLHHYLMLITNYRIGASARSRTSSLILAKPSIATLLKSIQSGLNITYLTAICSILILTTPASANTGLNTPARLANPLTQSVTSSSTDRVKVYFLNGIFNTDYQSQTAAIALYNRLKANPYFKSLVDQRQVSLATLYNPTDPFLGDLFELSAQATIQRTALQAMQIRVQQEGIDNKYDEFDAQKVKQSIFNEEIHKANQTHRAKKYCKIDFIHTAGNRAIDHYDKLAQEVKNEILSGSRVIIVAHSQGNYVAQGLYANLMADSSVHQGKLSDLLHIVGVANVAATTPSSTYLTNREDKAVYVLHTIQGGKPMPANFDAKFSNGESLGGFWETAVQRQNDSQNHGFIETYLSGSFDKHANFKPHSPEIVDATAIRRGSEPESIYNKIVQQVVEGIHAMKTS